MKVSTSLLLAGLGSTVLAADDRDLSGDIWKSTLEKRQTSWNPPAALVKPLEEVWAHTEKTYNNGNYLGFSNYGYDTLMASGGTLNFCVRWDSKVTVTAAQRAAVAASLQTNVLKWTDKLTGFMGWPYDKIPVKVTGWATKDTSLLQGLTTSEKVYTTLDSEGVAECDPRCGRSFHTDGNYDSCPGGAANRYDMSLWLTSGMEGGAGGDWGQRVGAEYFLGALDNPHIWLHEFGHTMALDDFYDWVPTGVTSFIMLAGSSMTITDFDTWMMRDWWRHLASRYNLPAAAALVANKPAISTSKTSASPVAPTTAKTTLQTSAKTTAKAAAATTSKTTLQTSVKTTANTTSKVLATATSTDSKQTAAPYAQCGGMSWTGPTTCGSGWTCRVSNPYFSQCVQ